MICNICQKSPAVYDPYWGWLPCEACQNGTAKNRKRAGEQTEFVSEAIKEDRRRMADDIEPQHIKGYLNKRWVELYGVKRAKELGYSDKEIRESGYHNAGSSAAYQYYKKEG